jgi:hypothetical protein
MEDIATPHIYGLISELEMRRKQRTLNRNKNSAIRTGGYKTPLSVTDTRSRQSAREGT